MTRFFSRRVLCRWTLLSLVLLILLPSLSRAETIEDSLEAFGLYIFKSSIVAPDFTTTDLQGNPVRLEDYRGKVILLVFWATW